MDETPCNPAAEAESAPANSGGTAAAPASTGQDPCGGGLRAGQLPDNIAGMLAYLTIVPAIVLLIVEPYKRRPFVRFHALQCLFLAGASAVVSIGLMLLGTIPLAGVLVLLIGPMVGFLAFMAACVCLLKAYQGHIWKLPVIGEMAEKRAGVI